MGKQPTGTTVTKINDIRKYMIWHMDSLIEKLTDPDFTGTITLEISATQGRPGKPIETVKRYGFIMPK